MQIVKQKQTHWIETAPTTTVEEYLMTERKISGANAIVSGRYPLKGYVMNMKCTELALVISGGGFVGTPEEKIPIVIGDCIRIKAKEKYFWDGHMALFIACTPAWNPKQHKLVKK